MEKEIAFAKALQELKEMAARQENVVSKRQVQKKFADMSLSQSQLELVYEYLQNNKIGVDERLKVVDYLTKEEREYLSVYMEEIEEVEEVSDEEKEELILSAMAGDETVRTRLIESYLPKVVALAKLYVDQGVSLEDLIGEGNVALSIGVTMLGSVEDISKVERMLGLMIMDAMTACIKKNASVQKKDTQILEKINEVAEKAKALSEQLQRKITVEELAEETGIKTDKIQKIICILGGSMDMIEEKNDENRE